MTDPAGERSPRRRGRPSADRDGEAHGPARTPGRAARGGAGGDEPPGSGRAPARTSKSSGAKARTRTPDADGSGQAEKPGKPARRSISRAEPDSGGPEPERGAGGRWPVADRSLLATVLGIPPIAAVGLAAALTATGVLVDLTRLGNLSIVFTVCHISGCVLAVAWVRRSGLFGPMVQPPLLVAAAVPVVVALAGSPRPGQGVAERLLVIGAPLVNAFPVMAWATGAALALGLLRIALQRPLSA